MFVVSVHLASIGHITFDPIQPDSLPSLSTPLLAVVNTAA